MTKVGRKKPFSSLEKDLFLNIIQKYDTILTCKQTNATSAFKKKQSWDKIAEEFNESSIVTQKESTKQLIKVWYNMKAKARESKIKENIRHLTVGGPSIVDMDPIDSKVMNIDKNIVTNIAVDIDSDIDGNTVLLTMKLGVKQQKQQYKFLRRKKGNKLQNSYQKELRQFEK